MPSYSVSNDKFIEVDKTWRGDENLCWAAASSATLWLTNWANEKIGWNKTSTDVLAPMDGPNDVFRYTKAHFKDIGGWGFWHMLWFISGAYPTQPNDLNIANGGGFYSLTPQETLKYIYNVNPEYMTQLLIAWSDKLNGGGGFSSAFYFGSSSSEPESLKYDVLGEHEVPLWGYGLDEDNSEYFQYPQRDSISEFDPVRLTSVQISDPDDHIAGKRFWLRTYYCPGSHLYKCEPTEDAPSNWKNKYSIWLYALTLLRNKPSGLIPTRSLI